MSQQQQTVLRVQTNVPSNIVLTGTTSMEVINSTTGVTYSGTGTSASPYVGSFPSSSSSIEFRVLGGGGTFYYNITQSQPGITQGNISVNIRHATDALYKRVFLSYAANENSYFAVNAGDSISVQTNGYSVTATTFNVYFIPDVTEISNVINQYDYLDLISDIPIKINKSFAEIQDISKRNSDYSIGLKLPGSKKNNAFFENFYNVDTQSLFFDVTSKVQCQVLINDQSFFNGYMKLNRVNVKGTAVEYDVTLYSNIGDLFGSIGNNLLKDLDYRDPDYHFNHTFVRDNVLADWRYETLKSTSEVPSNYFYPVCHNGYNYESAGNTTTVLYTGTSGNSLYTTTKLGNWNNNSQAYAQGVKRYRINSPEDGIRDNQLKPALNVYSLIQLIFKTYGYTIKSDFMTTPWAKLLYTYGYFSNDSAKFTYQTPQAQIYGLDGVEVYVEETFIDEIESTCDNIRTTRTYTIYVVKKGTGIPCLCSEEINLAFNFGYQPCYTSTITPYIVDVTIPANTTGTTYTWISNQFVDCGGSCQIEIRYNYGYNNSLSNVSQTTSQLAYLPLPANTIVPVTENTYIDFSLVMDQNIKQIDVLSSIAKKFNLLFIPDPQVPNQIIIEPYDYYIGTGNIYDWTDKLSYDKGWSVEPALNFVETELILSDLEDGDQGNIDFKNSNNRIYGQNKVYNPTEFKSQTKKIETTFSSELIRNWNPANNPEFETSAVGIPLGINYAESSQEVGTTVNWIYKGVKTKMKLFFNNGNFSPFLDTPTEQFGLTGVTTCYFRMSKSDGTSPDGGLISPVISHTMPMGNPDQNKINNDSICILFNSEQPTTVPGQTVSLFNAYTNQDMYYLFYQNRINNIFDKNTRFLSGYFYLKLSDIQNLRPNDLIKIQEQYFTWNKIEEFNLTDRELTKVELIQATYNPQQYPERYFNYAYCEEPDTVYKFKTNFTGTNSIYESFYYYSILYDYFVGTLGGNVSGFTSSIPFTGNTYLPYSIWEVTEQDYLAGGISYRNDPQRNFFLLSVEDAPSGTIYNQKNSVWLINSGQTQARLNVFTGCTQFTSVAASLGVAVGSISGPGSLYTSGVTLNVTDPGWIKYTRPDGTHYQQITSTGTYVITDCIICTSVQVGIPFADLAAFTVVNCGSSC